MLDFSNMCGNITNADAALAHLVERHLAKVEVASSSLVGRSTKPIAFAIGFFICGYGGIGRHAGFRFPWETVQVQVLLPAPRQNKAARSCGGTSNATSTGDLVFPFPSQTHSVGLCDGFVSHLD